MKRILPSAVLASLLLLSGCGSDSSSSVATSSTVKVERGPILGAVVIDDNGHPRVGDSEGNNMTLPQFVESMKQDPDFAQNFEGSGSSGGGSSKSSAGGGRQKTIAADDDEGFIKNVEGIAKGEVSVSM